MKPEILRHNELPLYKLGEGVALKVLADEETGAKNIGMGWIIFKPGSKSSVHAREVEEYIYVLKGQATILAVDSGEEYIFGPGDLIRIPAGITHQHINNAHADLEQIYIFAPQGPEKPLRDLPIIEKL